MSADYADRILKARQKAGIGQRKFSRLLGVGCSCVQNWELAGACQADSISSGSKLFYGRLKMAKRALIPVHKRAGARPRRLLKSASMGWPRCSTCRRRLPPDFFRDGQTCCQECSRQVGTSNTLVAPSAPAVSSARASLRSRGKHGLMISCGAYLTPKFFKCSLGEIGSLQVFMLSTLPKEPENVGSHDQK